MKQPCLSCGILSSSPLISNLLKESVSFPVPQLLLPPPGAPWGLRAAGPALSPRSRTAGSEGGSVPTGMEREHPGSPLHAHVMCLEMSCRGEPCAFPPPAPLPRGRKDRLLHAVPASATAAFLGGEGGSRDTIYTLIYIHTRTRTCFEGKTLYDCNRNDVEINLYLYKMIKEIKMIKKKKKNKKTAFLFFNE